MYNWYRVEFIDEFGDEQSLTIRAASFEDAFGKFLDRVHDFEAITHFSRLPSMRR